MTADELIEKLKDLPPETPVLVEGYETGYDEISDLKLLEVFHYRNAPEWDGEYQTHKGFPDRDDKTISALALLGRRGFRRL